MRVTFENGVAFYENIPDGCEQLEVVSVELGGVLYAQAQLKNLRDVKIELSRRVKALGGNALVRFEYGQKSVGWFRALLQIDDVNWYGKGIAAKVVGRT